MTFKYFLVTVLIGFIFYLLLLPRLDLLRKSAIFLVVLTMLVMPLTFSITNGIGAGFVSYVLIKLASGKGREVHPALYVIATAFLIYFLRWALFDAQF